VKLSRCRHAGARVERKYSSYSFLTLTLDDVSGLRHAPALLYRGKGPQVPTGQEAGWASELVHGAISQKALSFIHIALMMEAVNAFEMSAQYPR
jgi:hypothetical protein